MNWIMCVTLSLLANQSFLKLRTWSKFMQISCMFSWYNISIVGLAIFESFVSTSHLRLATTIITNEINNTVKYPTHIDFSTFIETSSFDNYGALIFNDTRGTGGCRCLHQGFLQAVEKPFVYLATFSSGHDPGTVAQ